MKKNIGKRRVKNEKYKKRLTSQQRQENCLFLFFVYGKGNILLKSIV